MGMQETTCLGNIYFLKRMRGWRAINSYLKIVIFALKVVEAACKENFFHEKTTYFPVINQFSFNISTITIKDLIPSVSKFWVYNKITKYYDNIVRRFERN